VTSEGYRGCPCARRAGRRGAATARLTARGAAGRATAARPPAPRRPRPGAARPRRPAPAAPRARRRAARAPRATRRAPVTRALAPDLARGFALLFIALANAPYYLWGAQETGMTSAHPKGSGLLDSVVQAVTIVVIDGRTYPLFAFLFGYGIVQLHRRQLEAGTDERAARRLLQRRNLWLIAFGLVHAALLWMGDVLGAYGLAGLVFVGLFLLRRDRTLLVWAGILTGLLAFFAASSIVGGWAMSGL